MPMTSMTIQLGSTKRPVKWTVVSPFKRYQFDVERVHLINGTCFFPEFSLSFDDPFHHMGFLS